MWGGVVGGILAEEGVAVVAVGERWHVMIVVDLATSLVIVVIKDLRRGVDDLVLDHDLVPAHVLVLDHDLVPTHTHDLVGRGRNLLDLVLALARGREEEKMERVGLILVIRSEAPTAMIVMIAMIEVIEMIEATKRTTRGKIVTTVRIGTSSI